MLLVLASLMTSANAAPASVDYCGTLGAGFGTPECSCMYYSVHWDDPLTLALTGGTASYYSKPWEERDISGTCWDLHSVTTRSSVAAKLERVGNTHLKAYKATLPSGHDYLWDVDPKGDGLFSTAGAGNELMSTSDTKKTINAAGGSLFTVLDPITGSVLFGIDANGQPGTPMDVFEGDYDGNGAVDYIIRLDNQDIWLVDFPVTPMMDITHP